MKNIWRWFDNKKTVIGMAIMLVSQGAQLFFPGAVDQGQLQYIETVGALIGGFGLAHKGFKVQSSRFKVKSKK